MRYFIEIYFFWIFVGSASCQFNPLALGEQALLPTYSSDLFSSILPAVYKPLSGQPAPLLSACAIRHCPCIWGPECPQCLSRHQDFLSCPCGCGCSSGLRSFFGAKPSWHFPALRVSRGARFGRVSAICCSSPLQSLENQPVNTACCAQWCVTALSCPPQLLHTALCNRGEQWKVILLLLLLQNLSLLWP